MKSFNNIFNNRFLKIILVIVVFFVLFGVTSPTSADVSDYLPDVGTYVPLVDDIPGITGREANDLPAYLKAVFKIMIGVAAALAVIMITLGGIEYMSTDSMFGKSEGKHRIEQALLGLFLAIAAWLILYTINPKLLEFNFNPEKTVNNLPNNGTTTPRTTFEAGAYYKYRYCVAPPTVPGGESVKEQYQLGTFAYRKGDREGERIAFYNCWSSPPVASQQLWELRPPTQNCERGAIGEYLQCEDKTTPQTPPTP